MVEDVLYLDWMKTDDYLIKWIRGKIRDEISGVLSKLEFIQLAAFFIETKRFISTSTSLAFVIVITSIQGLIKGKISHSEL